LSENSQQFSANELVEKAHFFRSIRSYLESKRQFQSKQKKGYAEAYKVAFMVESCCKIRDLIELFEVFDAPKSVINSSPSKYPSVWDKI
jgi:hypothetical protein